MFQWFEKTNVIFFSCGYPLMGCQEIEMIKNLQNENIEKRFIPYRLKIEEFLKKKFNYNPHT